MIHDFESMLRLSSWLLGAGLAVQLATCFWSGALSFIVFAAVGGLLTGGGTLIFLMWLASGER